MRRLFLVLTIAFLAIGMNSCVERKEIINDNMVLWVYETPSGKELTFQISEHFAIEGKDIGNDSLDIIYFARPSISGVFVDRYTVLSPQQMPINRIDREVARELNEIYRDLPVGKYGVINASKDHHVAAYAVPIPPYLWQFAQNMN